MNGAKHFRIFFYAVGTSSPYSGRKNSWGQFSYLEADQRFSVGGL